MENIRMHDEEHWITPQKRVPVDEEKIRRLTQIQEHLTPVKAGENVLQGTHCFQTQCISFVG